MEDCNKVEHDTDSQSEDVIACTYYINACFSLPTVGGTSHEDNPRILPMQSLKNALENHHHHHHHHHHALLGYWWIKTTPGGLLLSFSRLTEAEEFFRTVDIAQVLQGPVQVARLPLNLPLYAKNWRDIFPTQYLLIRDVPWSVPVADVRLALEKHEIQVSYVKRCRQHICVQILEPMQAEWLIANGFDFYGVARFHVTCVYNENPPSANEHDVVQCYRCQGFGHIAPHCRQVPRCVRCGGPHNVNYCTRLRSQAICCNCTEAHHAAHKQCSVRLHMSQSIPVHFTLSTSRPIQSTAPISADPMSTKARCLL